MQRDYLGSFFDYSVTRGSPVQAVSKRTNRPGFQSKEIPTSITGAAALSLFLVAGWSGCALTEAEASSVGLRRALVVCVDAESGTESLFSFADGASCPPRHAAFIEYDVERLPGADPLPFDPPQEQQEQAEVEDAPMDRP